MCFSDFSFRNAFCVSMGKILWKSQNVSLNGFFQGKHHPVPAVSAGGLPLPSPTSYAKHNIQGTDLMTSKNSLTLQSEWTRWNPQYSATKIHRHYQGLHQLHLQGNYQTGALCRHMEGIHHSSPMQTRKTKLRESQGLPTDSPALHPSESTYIYNRGGDLEPSGTGKPTLTTMEEGQAE